MPDLTQGTTAYVITRPTRTPWFPCVSWFKRSGRVQLMGLPPMSMDAEQAIELGHMLVDAGLSARRTDG